MPVNLILPDWIGAPSNIGACSTLRTGGHSSAPYDDGSGSGMHGFNLGANVDDDVVSLMHNRQQLQTFLPSEPAWLQQVHGTAVVDAALAGLTGQSSIAAAAVTDSSATHATADASFTDQPGIVCVVTTADCLPVLLTDRQAKVVAAVHAGWRGLAAGIIEQTIAAMRARGAGELMAWLGPAIGAQHFEVGVEVRAAMLERDPRAEAAFRAVPGSSGKYLADLYHLARLVLSNSNVGRIAGGAHCTFSEASRFYSYRRDGKTGRIATMIWIKPEFVQANQ